MPRFSIDNFPRLVRQILSDALKNEVFEIAGTDLNMDVATRRTEGELTVAIVNHNSSPRKVDVKLENGLGRCLTKAGQEQAEAVRVNIKSNRIAIQIPINEAVTIYCKRF